MHSMLGMRLARNLQILASLLKEAVPRKAQPELAGYSGEGSRGKGQPGASVGDSSEFLWAREWQPPSEQVGVCVRQHIPASLLAGVHQAKHNWQQPSTLLRLWSGTFCVVTNYHYCTDGQLGTVIKQRREHFILPFKILVYLCKMFAVRPPRALPVCI